ncbi:ABC transporter ATP-binding protein [Candidatus Steffania adelgidicola]|uniref:ABC transporter ATP-binding protein n=1 Tax=Candidatus Steffania adelgidicola TaxID=1076626 RepID=UPI001D01D31E|nr:ABC transporter ATP-binding protein [Candidatus Steffania adelgidicola]UDG79885.1 ABC transporter ATP-binding protein uup [Candidatus Steffania adelgidicola]
MSLISLSHASLSFSDAPLLHDAALHIHRKERVCLVGRNGAGKSTLMKILSCEMPLDDGELFFEKDLIISRLQQDLPRDAVGRVFDFVAEGVKSELNVLKDYSCISQRIEKNPSEKNLAEMAQLIEVIDHQNLWNLEKRIYEIIAQIGLRADSKISSLSGGWMRKAALCRSLVCEPQVLLLDEPTNHLDIESIGWLEAFLKAFTGSIVFISHDRSFIREIATRIVDLDRGKLISWPGNYDKYLERKEDELRVQKIRNSEFDCKLAQEEAWIRHGIKARRRRNERRVLELKVLRKKRFERREVLGIAKMQVEEGGRSGKSIFQLKDISYSIEGKRLISQFSAQVQRGDKIAFIGPNGCGKTTLLKLMLRQLTVDSGHLNYGTKLEVAYLEQYSKVCNPELTVMENLAGGQQEIMVHGRIRHVLGYLQDFLFHPKRAMTPMKVLSGGERNRLLLARLFLKPSNLLILDEPSNDLDMETLELLEELLSTYQGTVLLVSHDRQFIDNLVTECWFFEGEGRIERYVGGYFDTQRQRCNRLAQRVQIPEKKIPESMLITNSSYLKRPCGSGKLTYKLERELEKLPAQIGKLEETITQLQLQIEKPHFFSQPQEVIQPLFLLMKETKKSLNCLFLRWEILEMQKNNIPK